MESVYYSAHSTLVSLFFNVVFTILILILLNAILRKISPRLVINQGELIIIYIMLSQASALAGHSMMQLLPPIMAAPYGLATPENEWLDIFGRYIPKWLVVSDEGALHLAKTFYQTLVEDWDPPRALWRARIAITQDDSLGRDDDTWASPILIHQV